MFEDLFTLRREELEVVVSLAPHLERFDTEDRLGMSARMRVAVSTVIPVRVARTWLRDVLLLCHTITCSLPDSISYSQKVGGA